MILKDQRGLTLIEVLAASVLLGIVIGAAMMLFSSLNLHWNSSFQKYTDDNKTTLTMDTISKNLASASKAFLVGNNELRFRSEKKYKSLIYTNNTLVLYSFTSGNSTTDAANFGNPTINLTNSPSLYTSPVTLADNVTAEMIQVWNGTQFVSLPSIIIKNGELIRLSFTFQNYKVNVYGTRSPVTVTKTAIIKLLLDH
jgi:prepilin-type N-terminal cleavage/methylation domain-containing protein